MHLPAGHALDQVLSIAQVGDPGAVYGLLVMDQVRAVVEAHEQALDAELGLVETPLAALPAEVTRPGREVLAELMRAYAEGSVPAAGGGG